MKKWLVFSVLALMSSLASAVVPVEGKDYTRIANPTPVAAGGPVEVREFFWYGCPHCFRLEPFMSAWLKTKPAGVNFARIPAALNPVWESNARGYYVAETLGIVEQTHADLFSAIQVKQQRLFDQASLAKFYEQYGVKPDNFNGLYNSFAVSAKVTQSRNLALRYQISGVPAVIVNGKYMVSGEGPQVVEVVKALVAQEQGKKAK